MREFIKLLIVSSLVACLFSISGCSQTGRVYAHNTREIQSFPKVLTYLAQNGIDVVAIGNALQFSFPVRKFFQPATADLFDRKQPVLQTVARIANRYPNASITVIGYSDTVYSRKDAQILSLSQAQAIAGFLWEDGIARARMTIRGDGSKGKINTLKTPAAANDNRRVVMLITPV